jgi:hypothetical protein
MPCGYIIDLARSLVLSRGWDIVTDRELLAHVRALTIDPRFVRNLHQLADLRDVADVEVTAATIREMASLNPYGDGSRRAVVVTSDVLFGMARMYQMNRLTNWRFSGRWTTPFAGLGSSMRKRNCFRPFPKYHGSLG